MKKKTSARWPVSGEATGPSAMRETVALPGVGLSIPVRAAKAKLSALLDLVAGGTSVTITSDGVPKARLLPVEPRAERKVFKGMGEYLLSQPVHGGPSAEEVVNEGRDARGW